MGQYNNKGLLNGYNKNNKERAKLDYYATPVVEVENILKTLKYDFSDKTILEPCIGGGHMASGIQNYLEENEQSPKALIGTDFKDRGFTSSKWKLCYELDFLDDDYPVDRADIVIMNPPYETLERFLIRALEIAQDKLIVLCRLQALEGKDRYEHLLKDNPPTEVYVYVDRIQCWKNGVRPTGSSAQAYCWCVWDKKEKSKETKLRWIRRSS